MPADGEARERERVTDREESSGRREEGREEGNAKERHDGRQDACVGQEADRDGGTSLRNRSPEPASSGGLSTWTSANDSRRHKT